MNPSIPPEFFSSSQFSKSDWEITLEEGNGAFQYPVVPAGAYSRLKILPLQVLLIQQILEHPDVVASVELPSEVHDFLAQHIHGTGRISETNVGYWGRNAEEIDVSFFANFEAVYWLPKLAELPQLKKLHLLHVTLSTNDLAYLSHFPHLTELSLGPEIKAEEEDSNPFGEGLRSLRCLRVFLSDSEWNENLLESLLFLPSQETLVHLEISVEGELKIPWELIGRRFQKLEFLRVDRSEVATAAELDSFSATIYELSCLTKLHVSYKRSQAFCDFFKTFQLSKLPMLTHLYLPWPARKFLAESGQLDASKLHLVPVVEMWNELGIKTFPLFPTWDHFPLTAYSEKPIKSESEGSDDDDEDPWLQNVPAWEIAFMSNVECSSSSVDTWVRYLRYAANHFDVLRELFQNRATSRPVSFIDALCEHPLFPSIFVQCMRINAEEPEFWSTMAPVMEFWFAGVSKLASPQANELWSLETATKRDIALRKMIFEGLAPIFERAIAVIQHFSDFGIDADSVEVSESNDLSEGEESTLGPYRFVNRPVLGLLRMIRIFARFPASDVYPSRLCLSKSAVIVKYLASPWHRLYRTLEACREFFTVVFSGVDGNQAMCDALEACDFSGNVEEMLVKWFPMTSKVVPAGSISSESLAPIPAILAALSPKYVKYWIREKPEFCRRVIRLIPHDAAVEWLATLSMIVTFHGNIAQEAPHDVICDELPRSVLRACNLHTGAITSHLMVFAGSFCRFCRQRFINPSEVTRHDGINAMTFMAKQKSTNPHSFAKPIAAWVLEPKARVTEWLMALKEEVIRHRGFEGEMQDGQMRLRDCTAMDFYSILNQRFWNAACSARDRMPVFEPLTDWYVQVDCENLAIISQVPLFCDFAWTASPATSLEWAEDVLVKLGQAKEILSLLYHMTCYRGYEVCKAWISKRAKISRNELGGRAIAAGAVIPGRLLKPVFLDPKTQEEDLLSIASETFLAGIFEFPRGSLFITLRVLANFSYYSPELRHALQQSQYVPKLLSHTLSLSENEGEILGALLLICEIFADVPLEIRQNLPQPILNVLSFERMRHYLTMAKGSEQPWWDCCAVFLIRAVFARAIPTLAQAHLAGNHATTSTEHPVAEMELNERVINDIQFLVDEVFRLAKRQDITTQEVAFEAIIEAFTQPTGCDARLRIAVSAAVARMISAKYEPFLLQQSNIEHFGYESKAKAAFLKYKLTLMRNSMVRRAPAFPMSIANGFD
jgi:hypothetical protein